MCIEQVFNVGECSLVDNKLGGLCGDALFNGMQHNKSITHLELRSNGIDPNVIESINGLTRVNLNIQKQVYSQSLQSETKGPWHRSRLMFIGQGMAGKTATIRSILSEQFDPHWKSTIGISLTETSVTTRGEWTSRDSGDFTSSLASKIAAANLDRQKIVIQQKDDMLIQKHGLRLQVLPHFAKKGALTKPKRMLKFEKLLMRGRDKKDDLTLSIWDYGGQRK